MKIQIVGGSATKCDQLARNAEDAARELDLDYTLQKVTSYHHLAKFGVMLTPALMVNGEIKTNGKVLSVEEIKALLQ